MVPKDPVRPGADIVISEFNGPLEFRVCSSSAGYYIGRVLPRLWSYRDAEYYARTRDPKRDRRNRPFRRASIGPPTSSTRPASKRRSCVSSRPLSNSRTCTCCHPGNSSASS